MFRKLKILLDFNTAKAVRNAHKAKQAIRDVGEEGEKANKGLKEGMDKSAEATGTFGKELLKLGASVVSISALAKVLDTVIAKYNEALVLKAKLAGESTQANAQSAGAASQFKLDEPAMRKLLVEIGTRAGAGKGDLPNLGGLMQALSSTQLIAGPSPNAPMSDADKATMTQIAMWQQRTTTTGASTNVAKLVAAMRHADPSISVPDALGMLETSFAQSELSDWPDYFNGMATGALGLLAKKVNPRQVLGEFSSLAKYYKSGVTAAEPYKSVNERFYLSDDPRMVAEVNKRYGEGTYWKLKREDPTQLHGLVMNILTGSEGEAQQALFQQLGVEPTMTGRLENMKAARSRGREIALAVDAAGPSTPRDMAWRAGPRARDQASGLRALEIGSSRGDQTVVESSLRKIGNKEQERAQSEDPIDQWLTEVFNTRSGEQNKALRRYIRRTLEERGRTDILSSANMAIGYSLITEDGLRIPYRNDLRRHVVPQEEVFSEIADIVGEDVFDMGGKNRVHPTYIGVQYNTTPSAREQTDLTRGQR